MFPCINLLPRPPHDVHATQDKQVVEDQLLPVRCDLLNQSRPLIVLLFSKEVYAVSRPDFTKTQKAPRNEHLVSRSTPTPNICGQLLTMIS